MIGRKGDMVLLIALQVALGLARLNCVPRICGDPIFWRRPDFLVWQ
ncbi:MAG: hypothetical protein ACYS76_15585 [Planctomycetota bacterium]